MQALGMVLENSAQRIWCGPFIE